MTTTMTTTEAETTETMTATTVEGAMTTEPASRSSAVRSGERGPVATTRRALASIRVRIVVGYLVLLTAGLAIAILVTRQVQLAKVDREIEQEQAQEIEELRRLAEGVDPETGQPFGDDVRAIFETFLDRNVPSDDEAFFAFTADGQFASTEAPPLFGDPQFRRAWQVDEPTVAVMTADVTHANGDPVGEVRSLAVPMLAGDDIGGIFVVASFPADDEGEVADVVRVITLAGLVVLLLTAALAWSLAGRVLRPVRELTATARGISESDLSGRIPVEGHDELAELGATFNEMVDRLEEGFTSQRRFLDDVAHELRTPITIARGHLEVLGDDPEERAETVAVVTDELDRMSRYVADLLVLAKAEQPDFLVTEPIDLGELALDLHQRVRALGPRAWVLDAAPPVDQIAVVADRERLMQAVLNLATNAVQHTEPDAEIGLGVSAHGHHAHLWVRDTGPGVDPAVADKLFDRYSRSARNRTRRPEGAGIGLSIVDAIARAHGGSVSVDSPAGEGATFTIAIPLGASPWPPPPAPDPRRDPQ
jgi:two-component system, OmpR family, sensor kinase